MINYNEGENFTILPNNVIWCAYSRKEERWLDGSIFGDGITLINGINNNKIIAVLSYINSKENRRGYSEFTLEELITYCGLKPRKGKKGSNEQFKELLLELVKYDIIIDINDTVVNSSPKSIIMAKFNIEVEDKFFKIDSRNVDKIMSVGNCDNITVLNLYSYILARLDRRDRDLPLEENGLYIGGHAEAFYQDEEKIASDLNISVTTLEKAIKILKELKLIYVDNIGLVKKKDKIHMANNVYVVKESELEQALEESKYYYKKEGYIITDKKSTKEVKQTIGLMGKIASEKKKGNNTSDLEKKLKCKDKEIKKSEIEESKEYIRDEEFSDWLEDEDIDTIKERVIDKAMSNPSKYKVIIDNWSNRYQVKVEHCDEAYKLVELEVKLNKYDKIHKEKIIKVKNTAVGY